MTAYLDQDQASVYLAEKGFKIAPKTFGKLRVVGGGPRYRKFGRKPIYDPLDLDQWAEEKLSAPLRSTSEELPSDTPAADRTPPRRRPRRASPPENRPGAD
jgi:hypothetical protein